MAKTMIKSGKMVKKKDFTWFSGHNSSFQYFAKRIFVVRARRINCDQIILLTGKTERPDKFCDQINFVTGQIL